MGLTPTQQNNPRRAVATKLTVLARQLWQRFDRSVGGIGVSRAQWRLIAVVSRAPGATQRLIAEVLEVSEVTAGRLIDRLLADGYLERQPSATDRRAHSIYLTPKAQPVLDQLSELARVEEDEAFAGLTDQELDKLEALLETLSRNIATARVETAAALPPKLGQATPRQTEPAPAADLEEAAHRASTTSA